MSGFCRQVKSDASAYAICRRMAESHGFRPKRGLTPVEVYSAAIEAAEREEAAQRAALMSAGEAADSFQFSSNFHRFLSTQADMRIPWLFDDLAPDRRAEKIFLKVNSRIESLKEIAAGRAKASEGPVYTRELALEIFEYVIRPKELDGLGITFDYDQEDPQKNAIEVIEAGRATCIEFAILYIALAKLAGVDARPVHVHSSERFIPWNHALVGVELDAGDILFMDLMGNRYAYAIFPKDRTDAGWSFMSRLELVAHDLSVRASNNPPPGVDGPEYEHMASRMRRALAFAPHDPLILSNMGYIEYKYGDNFEISLRYLMMSAEANPNDRRTQGLIRLVRKKIEQSEE